MFISPILASGSLTFTKQFSIKNSCENSPFPTNLNLLIGSNKPFRLCDGAFKKNMASPEKYGYLNIVQLANISDIHEH